MYALISEMAEAFFDPLHYADQAALHRSARMWRLQQQHSVRFAMPSLCSVFGKVPSGRMASTVVVHAEVIGSVMRIHDRDKRNMRPREAVGNYRRALLIELELDRHVHFLFCHGLRVLYCGFS